MEEDVKKSVVSSLAALAIAIAPGFAMAAEKSAEKAPTSKVAKPKKNKAEKKPEMVRVQHVAPRSAHAAHVKPMKGGHQDPHKGEPRLDQATVVPASATSK